jgi:hypothetical protein
MPALANAFRQRFHPLHHARVVQGASRTLERHRPIVLYECFHGGDEIPDRLEAPDYIVLDADRRGPRDERSTNFVAIPSRYFDRHGDLMEHWRRAELLQRGGLRP